MKHLQKFPENLDNVPLTEKNSATLSDGTRRFVGENNIQSDWAQKQVEKGRPRFHTREPPQLNAFDTEARRGNLLVICSPTMHLEYDKAAGPMPLLTWLWEQASDTNFLYNLSYDRDVILKPLSERMKKGDHEVDLGPFNIKLLGNKAFALRFRGDKNIKGSHRIKRFFDVAGFFDDGERHLSLEEASNIFLNSGKLKDVDRARLGEEEGYYEARREETIRYCKRDAELTLKLGELLIKSLHDALGFYPSRFNSKASVAKAWIEVYHPEVMVKKRSSRASLARSSYRGGIFITRVLGRVKDVSELDISCLPDGTMIEGRAIELIQKGDVVNGQTVTDVQTFENAPCIEIETASGHRIISTPNHRHMVPVSGTTKSVPRRADSLRRDGYLRVDDWPSDPLPVDAVITGILHAEGCWVFDKLVWKKDTRTARGGQYGINHSLRITVDERETELRSFIRAYLADRGYHFSETVKRGTHGLTFRLWRETDVRKLKDVYDRVLSSDSELNVRGFLRGFFEGDGTVNGARRSVSAVQSDENKYLAVVDRIHLLDFHPALYTLMRSQTGRAPYTHRRAHAHPDAQTNMIEIVSREVPRWMRLVGFVSRAKRSRVAAKIVSKRLTEPRRVHDITLDGDHTYFANGVWTHNSAYGDALRKIARLDRLTETGWDVETPQKYHANAQYGAYWILIDYDGRLPMDPRWRNKERGKARIMYANSNGKKRPYTATKAEMDYFISTGRVTEADIVISNEWLGPYEPQFPELQELLDKVRALKEPAKTDPLSAVMRMLFKTVINCLSDDTILSDGRRVGDLKVGDVVDGQRVTDVRRSIAPAFKLTLDSGHAVVATANHRFQSEKGWEASKRLFKVSEMSAGPVAGYNLIVDGWNAVAHPDEAVFAGIMWAEGSWYLRRKTWIKDYHGSNHRFLTKRSALRLTVASYETELRNFIRGFLTARGYHFKETVGGGTYHNRPVRCADFAVWREADVEALDRLYRKCIVSTDPVQMRGFLCGAFEGDGTGRARNISISQTADEKRQIVERMLQLLGFKFHRSNISFRVTLPQGNTIDAVAHTLTLKKPSVGAWMREVGFLSEAKRSKICGKLLSKTSVGNIPVTDITLNGSHLFWANGIMSHNSAYGCLAESKHGETPFTTWPLAAEITGRCRVSIWKEWDNIVAQGGVILSVNTDSLRYVLPSETVMREHAPIGDFEHKFFKSITTHYQSGIAVIEVPSPPPPPYLRKRGKPLLTYEMLMAAKGPILAIPSRHVTHLFEALNNNNRGRIGVFDNPDDEDDDTCLDLTSNLWALAYNPDHLRFEYLNKTATVGTPYPFDEVTGDIYNSAVRGTREKSGVKKIRKDWEKGRVSLRAVPT